MEIKTIGVLTSGGDAPGMNAAVRAVVRAALAKNIKVIGIRRGYNGLIYDDVFEMDLRSVSISSTVAALCYIQHAALNLKPKKVCKRHSLPAKNTALTVAL